MGLGFQGPGWQWLRGGAERMGVWGHPGRCVQLPPKIRQNALRHKLGACNDTLCHPDRLLMSSKVVMPKHIRQGCQTTACHPTHPHWDNLTSTFNLSVHVYITSGTHMSLHAHGTCECVTAFLGLPPCRAQEHDQKVDIAKPAMLQGFPNGWVPKGVGANSRSWAIHDDWVAQVASC